MKRETLTLLGFTLGAMINCGRDEASLKTADLCGVGQQQILSTRPQNNAVFPPMRHAQLPDSPESLPPSGKISINGVEVSLFWEKKSTRGDLLVLPGWNFGRLRWCEDSSLCERARKAGYRLVLPEMGKSVYARNHFPETRKEWRDAPTLAWLTTTMIPELQKRFGIFRGQNNFLVGLSTGARGVILVAMETGKLFKAGAALSGDYDQTMDPSDRLMIGFYGPYSKYRERWATVDNPSHFIGRLRIPIFFGHGIRDSVVPVSQTKVFFTRLKRENPELSGVILHLVDAGHNFEYWDAEVDAILTYFNRLSSSQGQIGPMASK